MVELMTLGKILGLSFFITKFAPFQWVSDLFEVNQKTNPILVVLKNTFIIIIGCFPCCSFWVGFFTFGLWFGISAYVIAYFYNQLLAPFIEKIRLY